MNRNEQIDKALKDILKDVDCAKVNKQCDIDYFLISSIEKCAKAALSSPPRNCDVGAEETDAQIAFLNEVWLISVTKETALERDRFDNWTDEMRSRYAKWLLAPAAERKGKSDGR